MQDWNRIKLLEKNTKSGRWRGIYRLTTDGHSPLSGATTVTISCSIISAHNGLAVQVNAAIVENLTMADGEEMIGLSMLFYFLLF